MVGLGAFKYFMLKVDPQKRMMFNPEESIDFNGNTGPFHTIYLFRINSLINKYGNEISDFNSININREEQNIIKNILEFPKIIQESASNYNPSHIANYVFELVKNYNSYYQNNTILVDDPDITKFRINIVIKTGSIIKISMKLLGINISKKCSFC